METPASCPRPWAALALAAACMTCIVASAQADPRWWWSDMRLTDTPGDSITPHLRTPGYASGGAGGSSVFLTWAEVAPGGDLDVWLTASFDGGCTFCEPTPIARSAADEVRPRVAVLALPEGTWSIAVILERRGTGEVVIAWDSTRVSFRVPFEELCPQITALGPAIDAAGQHVTFGGATDSFASGPDISAAGSLDFGHFHATWEEQTIIGPAIKYAHDLTARGGAGWSLDPVRTLAMLEGGESAVHGPRIAADLATDPDPDTGLDTRNRSAVNVTWVRHRSTGPTRVAEIMGLRSVDSGASFSPSGARAMASAEPLSQPLPGGHLADVRAALDAAFNSFSTTEPAWVGAAWSVEGPDAPRVGADSRFMRTPAGPLPDWQSGADDEFGDCARPGDGAPSVALQHVLGVQPAPHWLAWQDSRTGDREIVVRAGMLDPGADPPLDRLAYPLVPVRPLDTAISSDVQLSHCRVDDATLLCPTTRSAGEASDVSLDANEFGVFAAWSDTRHGNAEIFFKRLDTFVTASQPALATACEPDGTAHVDVTFPLNASCPDPFAGERMLRYLIYWRTEGASSYANAASPIVVDHAGEAGPDVTRRLWGLPPGASIGVIVVPEDEARNVSPPDFDPLAAPALPPFNERIIVTAEPCVAVEPCLWRSDVTSLRPHVPSREATYLVPPRADGVHLQGPAYDCPVASGHLERDAAALDNGVPLSLYQVNRPVGGLRLEKSGRTIQFTW